MLDRRFVVENSALSTANMGQWDVPIDLRECIRASVPPGDSDDGHLVLLDWDSAGDRAMTLTRRGRAAARPGRCCCGLVRR